MIPPTCTYTKLDSPKTMVQWIINHLNIDSLISYYINIIDQLYCTCIYIYIYMRWTISIQENQPPDQWFQLLGKGHRVDKRTKETRRSKYFLGFDIWRAERL